MGDKLTSERFVVTALQVRPLHLPILTDEVESRRLELIQEPSWCHAGLDAARLCCTGNRFADCGLYLSAISADKKSQVVAHGLEGREFHVGELRFYCRP